MEIIAALGAQLAPYVAWILAGIGAIFGLGVYHDRKVEKAREEGREESIEEIENQLGEERRRQEDEADEIDREVDALDSDDLRERMRDEARGPTRR